MKPHETPLLTNQTDTNDASWFAACCNCFCGWMREDNTGPGGPSSVCGGFLLLAAFGAGGYFLANELIPPSSPSVEDNCKKITYTDLAGQDVCFKMVGVSPEGSNYYGNATLCPDDNSRLNVDFFEKNNWQAVTFSSLNNEDVGTVTLLYSGHIDKIVGNLTFTKTSECSVAVSYVQPPTICASMTYINNDQQGCYFSLTDLNPPEAAWTGSTDLMLGESATAFYDGSTYITTDFDIYCPDYAGHTTIYSEPTGELNVNGPVQATPIDPCTLAINYTNSGLFGLRGSRENNGQKSDYSVQLGGMQ